MTRPMLETNVLEIIEMNSQVDSNGEDCYDYQKWAGNINQNDEGNEMPESPK